MRSVIMTHQSFLSQLKFGNLLLSVMRAAKTIKQLKNEFEKMHSVGRQRRGQGGRRVEWLTTKQLRQEFRWEA